RWFTLKIASLFIRELTRTFLLESAQRLSFESFVPAGKCEQSTALRLSAGVRCRAMQRETHPDDPINCSAPFRTLLSASVQRKHWKRLHANYWKAMQGLKKPSVLPTLAIILGTSSRIG